MDIKRYIKNEGELPLDNIVTDGGLARIFRKVGFIGDSLSSGEFETFENGETGYHDMYEYSWGQYMARAAGFEAINFSIGGLTAHEFMEKYYTGWGCHLPEKRCQAYVIALGVNDMSPKRGIEFGSIEDVHPGARGTNPPTFMGDYARIIQTLKGINPKAKFFLVTAPRVSDFDAEKHARAMHEIAALFKNTYVIDLYKYAPVYDEDFKRRFFLRGHMNPAGYILTADMVLSYIDYIIRNNPEDFATVPFIDKPFYN